MTQPQLQARLESFGALKACRCYPSQGAPQPDHSTILRLDHQSELLSQQFPRQTYTLHSSNMLHVCRLVLNATTKQPKGTAFIEFENAASAQKAAQASAKGR